MGVKDAKVTFNNKGLDIDSLLSNMSIFFFSPGNEFVRNLPNFALKM